MTIKLTQFNRVLVTLILTSILLPAAAPKANASIFDWFSVANNANQASASSQDNAYLTANSVVAISNGMTNDSEKSVLIDNGFLLATGLTSKNSTVKNSTEKIASYIIRELIVSISAYSSTPDQTDSSPFITARGTYVRDGIVAANFLPFGTKIKIPAVFGDKVFVVEDRMNKRYWQKIDIWFPDRGSALEFGLRTLKIQILES